MIRIAIGVDHRGCLRRFSASGHAQSGRRGQDVVCAAATAVLRTAARLLYRQPDFRVAGEALQAGDMALDVLEYPSERSNWLSGVTAFLISGIEDIAEEHPAAIELTVEEDG